VGFPEGKPAEAVCKQCSGELYQRDDDKRETILNRMNVYKKNTQPLISFFEEKTLLEQINGLGTLEEISARIIDLFNKKEIK
jgi:adenylate kinase